MAPNNPGLFTTLQRLFIPRPDTVSLKEKLISGLAGMVAILLIMAISAYSLAPADLPWVVASMGASAVLLFAVPHGPLSQPWNLAGGHLISAFIGITIAQFIPETITASALAVGLAISVMYITRCLHPPGGATALTAVVGGPSIQALGYQYMVTPILLNVVVMLAWALLINNLIHNRRYPESLKQTTASVRQRRTAPKSALDIAPGDLEYAMREMGEYVDVSVSDLRALIELTASHAAGRKLGGVRCHDIMTPAPDSVDYDTRTDTVWRLMAKFKVRGIPVVDRHQRVIGIVTVADFLHHIEGPDRHGPGERLKRFLTRSTTDTTDKPEYAGHLMSKRPVTVNEDQAVMELFPIYLSQGCHHLPVVDADGRLTGMLTPKDLLRALYDQLLHIGARP